MSDDYESEIASPTPPHQYVDKIEQLRSIAQELEKRLSPILRPAEENKKEPMQGAGTQQLHDLIDPCRRYESILRRIEL